MACLKLNFLIFRFSSRCKKIMYLNSTECTNDDCIILQSDGVTEFGYDDIFDIGLSVSDHTGTLNNCRLVGSIAENLLGCSMADFKSYSTRSRGEIKWRWLLERCTLKLLIKRKSVIQSTTKIIILDCSSSSSADVLERIKLY